LKIAKIAHRYLLSEFFMFSSGHNILSPRNMHMDLLYEHAVKENAVKENA